MHPSEYQRACPYPTSVFDSDGSSKAVASTVISGTDMMGRSTKHYFHRDFALCTDYDGTIKPTTIVDERSASDPNAFVSEEATGANVRRLCMNAA